MTQSLQQIRQAVPDGSKVKKSVLPAQNPQLTAILEQQHPAGLRGLAGSYLRQALPLVQQAFQKNFYPAAAGLGTIKPRRNDFRIIEYQQVTGIEHTSKIAENPVFNASRCAVDTQQAAGAALIQRLLGDQLRGQFVVKISAFHCRGLPGRSAVATGHSPVA